MIWFEVNFNKIDGLNEFMLLSDKRFRSPSFTTVPSRKSFLKPEIWINYEKVSLVKKGLQIVFCQNFLRLKSLIGEIKLRVL